MAVAEAPANTRCNAAASRSTGGNARSRTDFSLHNSQSQWKIMEYQGDFDMPTMLNNVAQ